MNRDQLAKLAHWNPPGDWLRIVTVDAHTAGEPLRVLVSGYPTIAGDTILERRRFMRATHDEIRRALMWEPRGHADMYGCIIVPPERVDSDFGVLFTHNEGYSTMCGHGIIAVTKVAVEMGLVKNTGAETVVRIDTPAGRVVATAHARPSGSTHRSTAESHDGDVIVDYVTFVNVAAFVDVLDEVVSVGMADGSVRDVRYDIGFGGAYYAYVDVASVGLECTPAHYRQLIETGSRIKQAVVESRDIVHPESDDLGFLYGVIFCGPPEDPANHSRHVCIFADGELDRSPTGTGVSGRAALLHARGSLGTGSEIQIESILGTTFGVGVKQVTTFRGIGAVVPVVRGRAYITGRTEHWIDPTDPLAHGFILR